MKMLAFAFAFLAGALVTLQIGSNARLRDAMGGALPAIIVSSALGIVLLWAAMLCLAGVWAYNANQARQILEQGDLEEALNAAAAIGDDRLQQRSQGRVVPESFTHGSSAQRVRWFKQGFGSGDVGQCDTFRD